MLGNETIAGPSSSGEVYKFFAFISYSHADEAFVKKLQDRIEAYRLPSSLHRLREGLPRKVHPLFRDATDLPPGQLTEEIRKKLAESKYLLVICSPGGARSEWVGREIEEFRRLGRHDRIIPVIIRGEVNARDAEGRPDPERECFPAPLLDEVRAGLDTQLLGVSVPHDGPRRAILKVIAKMLELDPDDLIARDQARQRRERLTRFSVAAALALILGLGGWYYWDYHREKVSFFADYVDQWGLPQGIFPLTEAETAGRSEYYRFLSQRRKLIEVRRLGPAGLPAPAPEFLDRPVNQRFLYEDQSGRLLEARHLDRNDNLQMRLVFSGDRQTAIDFKRANEENETLQAWLAAQTTSAAGGAFGDSGATRGQVQRWRVTRDAEGRPAKIEYKQLESTRPARDQDGVYGQELALDELGRVRKRLYLDAEGKNFTTPTGQAGRLYTYDGPDLVEIVNIDARGNPVLDDRRRVIVSRRFDERGREIERRSLNRDRALAPDEEGIAKRTWKYDDAGRPVEEAYFGPGDQPWRSPGGYASWRMGYEGDRAEQTFFGPDGRPTADIRGVARVDRKYDQRGHPLETAYYDLDGQPCPGPEGGHKVVNTFDSRGRIIEEAFFDGQGRPLAGAGGYARVTRTFTEFGALAEEAFWGPDGKPALNRDGYARLVNDYDDRGAAEAVTYYGVDGRRCLGRQGFSRLSIKTDTFGRPRTLAFFGVDDRPVESLLGYARSETTWNERNLITEVRFFDAEGRPTDPSGGQVAGLKYEYDDQGRHAATALIGLDGRVKAATERSKPEAVDFIPESGPVNIHPQMVDFGVFSGPVTAEVTLYNLTDAGVTLSRALSGQERLTAEYPGGRVVPPRGTAVLKISFEPPAEYSGRLDGEAFFLATSLPDQPVLVIPVLGQYNPDRPRPPAGGRPKAQVIPIIGYNPKGNPADPFDYSELVVEGANTTSTRADGGRDENTFDEQGRLSATQAFEADGRPGSHQTFTYGPEGRLVESTKSEPDGVRTVFKYDQAGAIVESAEIHPDGSRIVFTFKNGEVAETTRFKADGSVEEW